MRLRSMVINGNRTVLVLDRVGPVTAETAAALKMPLAAVADGALLFPGEVELPDEEVTSAVLQADTRCSQGVDGQAGVMHPVPPKLYRLEKKLEAYIQSLEAVPGNLLDDVVRDLRIILEGE